MFKKPIFWIIVVAVIAVIAYVAKEAMALYNYCWAIAAEKTKVISVGVSKVKAEVFIRFKNRSGTNVNILGYKFDVFLNGIKISEVSSKQKQILKGGGMSDLSIMIEANPKEVFKSDKKKLAEIVKYLALDKSKVMFTVSGSVSVGALGITASNIAVDFSMSLKDMMAPSTEPTEPCK